MKYLSQAFLAVIACSLSLLAQSATIEQLEHSFRTPPPDARIMMRWWWFGPVADTAELEREMIKMKEGGMGGFEVQPVYPVVLDNELPGITNKKYLSPEFLKALIFTADKAKQLSLRMDVTLGSGWPYGGPTIPITQAAGRLTMITSTDLHPGAELTTGRAGQESTIVAAFLVKGTGRNASMIGARSIPIPADGKVKVPADIEGFHSAVLFVAGHTRQAVKRAGVGGEGLVLDHYNRPALDNFLTNVAEPLLKPLAGRMPYALFCDSLEVFGSDWTADLLPEFRKRRGYDLKPYLTALSGDIGDKTGAIRNDWITTLTELAEERFLKPLHAFAQDHGTRLRTQTYGTPPVNLSSQQYVDLPEGEEPHWKKFTPTKWASSGSHLFDKPVTSSETWTWLHSPAFRATPLDMKVEADRHFLIGINQLIGHGWPYSPPEAGEPGWRFYASAVFNHHNPWWIVMPEVTSYLQRVSFLLRQGKPANDVALYLPIADIRAGITLGHATIDRATNQKFGPALIPQILESGYQYDLFDDGTSNRIAGRYPIVILPDVTRIPVETYRRLEAFTNQGGILIATKRTPSQNPGLMGAEEQSAEIRKISHRLFEDPGHKAHLVADDGPALRETLHKLRKPDVSLAPAAPEVGFIHRSTPDAEIYFVANTGNNWYSGDALFRVQGMSAEVWDPFTGTVQRSAGDRVQLDLPPYASTVIVFSRRKLPDTPKPRPFQAMPAVLELSTGWKVTFAPGQALTMDQLRSWTDDGSTRFYSGTATYERTVNIPDPKPFVRLSFGEAKSLPNTQGENRPGMRAWIEAPIRDAAIVFINGKRAGSVWKPPYSLSVDGFLKAGQNTIRIEVANTAINKLAAGPLPDYKDLISKYGDRFQPQDMNNLQPLPSGLLGAVTLLGSVR